MDLKPDEYEAMLAAQGGVCAICRTNEPGGYGDINKWYKRFQLDHDHSCCPQRKRCRRCIRGLLCAACNRGIGHLQDNPAILRRAADYIESFKVKEL